jgi:hypothetical protein
MKWVKLKPLHLKSGMDKGVHSPLCYLILSEFLSTVIRQEKEIKVIQIRKGKVRAGGVAQVVVCPA